MQFLASGKVGSQRYANNDLAKPVAALDIIEMGQQSQRALEETQGYSLSNEEGSADSQNDDLSIINSGNVGDYDDSLAKTIQTYVANNSYLDVDPSSTANNIVLVPRKIADIASPDGTNYGKATSLPFNFRDNLRFTFRAKITNTSAVAISIPALAGLSGSIDLISQQSAALAGGEIIANNFYTIVLTTISTVKKAIFVGAGGTAANYDVGVTSGKIPVIGTQSATTSLAGLSYLPSQITIANNALDANNDIDFSAGNFTVSNGSAQGVSSAETKRLDATWAAGNNAGGLAAGLTKTAGTWYDCFKLYNPTTGATGSGFDTSATASNLLADPAVITAGFTKYKRVNSIQTNSSTNNITPIKQIGNRTYYSGQWYQDISAATTSTSSVITSLTMPPRPGLIAITQINFIANNDVGSARGLIQNNDFSATLSDTLFNLYAQDITTEIERTNQELEIPTDSSGRVKRIFSGVIGCSLNLWTKGWIDTTL